jgi:pyridoxamine 5'-phosphate oxidase-like protein
MHGLSPNYVWYAIGSSVIDLTIALMLATKTTIWPDSADEILRSDQAVALAYVTPASGVVLTPLTNFGIVDRADGRLTPVNSSIGMWRKLEQLQRNPRVAVAYHTRQHGFSDRPEYVLVQGTASLSPLKDRGWLQRHRENWERFGGPRDVGRLWERWLRIYHWRVGIELAVERVLVWPDLGCRGDFEGYGTPPPQEPPRPQDPPAKGVDPRINHRRAAKRGARLPNCLLGWVGADGFPVVVSTEVAGVADNWIVLETPRGIVPPGGRRAGLVAHDFARFTYGQRQRKHTGWLRAEPGRVVYAPHTEHGYYLPWSRTAYRLAAGFVTRRGYGQGRRTGFLPN